MALELLLEKNVAAGTKVNGRKVDKMDKAQSSLVLVFTEVNSKITRGMVMEHSNSETDILYKGIGKIVSCMVFVRFDTQMVQRLKVNSRKEERMVME